MTTAEMLADLARECEQTGRCPLVAQLLYLDGTTRTITFPQKPAPRPQQRPAPTAVKEEEDEPLTDAQIDERIKAAR